MRRTRTLRCSLYSRPPNLGPRPIERLDVVNPSAELPRTVSFGTAAADAVILGVVQWMRQFPSGTPRVGPRRVAPGCGTRRGGRPLWAAGRGPSPWYACESPLSNGPRSGDARWTRATGCYMLSKSGQGNTESGGFAECSGVRHDNAAAACLLQVRMCSARHVAHRWCSLGQSIAIEWPWQEGLPVSAWLGQRRQGQRCHTHSALQVERGSSI